MLNQKKPKVLVYPHRNEAHRNKKGEAPLRIKITAGPKDSVTITPKIWVDPDLWDSNTKNVRRVAGRTEYAKDINKEIQTKLDKIDNAIDQLRLKYMGRNRWIRAAEIKEIVDGKRKVVDTLISFTDKLVEMKREERDAGGISEARFKKYPTFREKIECFLTTHKDYHKDWTLQEANNVMWSDFERWLGSQGGIRPGKANTIDKKGFRFSMPMEKGSVRTHLSMLKTLFNKAVEQMLIPVNPYRDKKIEDDNVSLPYLEVPQLLRIANLEIPAHRERLGLYRDLFVFSCFTGLSYGDLMTLNKTDFIGDSGQTIPVYADRPKYIFRGRKKTNEMMLLELFPEPFEILKKYKDHPDRTAKAEIRQKRDHQPIAAEDLLLPYVTLQKYNEHLKEIQRMAKIDFKHMRSLTKEKTLSSNMGRHTFATMMLNTGEVSVPELANMLGHKTTQMAEHYARLLPIQISNVGRKAYKKLFGDAA